jgi:hypothetical protein
VCRRRQIGVVNLKPEIIGAPCLFRCDDENPIGLEHRQPLHMPITASVDREPEPAKHKHMLRARAGERNCALKRTDQGGAG